MRLALLLLVSAALLPADVIYTLNVSVASYGPGGPAVAPPSQVFSLDLPTYLSMTATGASLSIPNCSLLGNTCGDVFFIEDSGPFYDASQALFIEFQSAQEPDNAGIFSESFQFNGATVDQLGTFTGSGSGHWDYPTTATLTIVDPPGPNDSVPEPASWALAGLAAVAWIVSRLRRAYSSH